MLSATAVERKDAEYLNLIPGEKDANINKDNLTSFFKYQTVPYLAIVTDVQVACNKLSTSTQQEKAEKNVACKWLRLSSHSQAKKNEDERKAVTQSWNVAWREEKQVKNGRFSGARGQSTKRDTQDQIYFSFLLSRAPRSCVVLALCPNSPVLQAASRVASIFLR